MSETLQPERTVVLGPLFTAGAALVAYGLLRRRAGALALGLGAMWADRRTELGRDLAELFRPPPPSP